MTPRVGLGALEEPQFRLLFLGQAVTAAGDRISLVALPFAVLAITTSVTAIGVVLAAYTVSMVVFLLLGGVLADRMSRRNVMISADLIRALSQGATAYLLVEGRAEVWHLALAQVVNGAAMAFFMPAGQGLIPDTVSTARLQQANALLSLSRNVTGVGGPAVAGLLVATVGAGWAIGLDAVTFLASALLLGRLSIPAVERRAAAVLADLRDGWREFTRRTWVWASVANFALFHMIVLAPVSVLGPYVAETELGGASAWATILVGVSIGAIAGSAIAVRWVPRRTGLVVFGSIVPYSVPVALLAIPAPTVAVALASAGAMTAMSIGGAVWFTALQERIPPHARSRVSSYDWIGSLIFMPLGLALVGPLSEAIGVTATLLAAAFWAAAGGIGMMALPFIRALRADDGGIATALADERGESSRGTLAAETAGPR